ncbi:MAG: phospho-N-acetylmuramoyl-pentapeptide-transferase, partial [bacterium]|nr:phospho-N-acetylmuramoyl-pentapeptide-transferase [bacterium]
MSLTFEVTRILALATIAFLIAMALTPILIRFLYKYRLGKQIRTEGAPIFSSLHKKKEGTPTMGGILIWFTVLILALGFSVLDSLFDGFWAKLNFLSRPQTLLPLGVLVASALMGLGDDLLGIFRIGPKGGGLKMRHRLLVYTAIAIVGAWWFYFKLDWNILFIPFLGNFIVGFWYIPIFIFVIVATAFSLNETDGLDGLAGGVSLVAFASFGVIAFFQGRYDLAAFCAAIVGALVAFLWFNVYPARFFMGDTGSMSLGVTLGVIAMLTNSLFLLPFICFVMVLESSSVILQVLSKKLRKKKIFL